MPKRFTLDEAQKLIPRVDALLRQAIEIKGEFETAAGELRQLQEHLMMMGGVVVDRERAIALRQGRDAAGARLRVALEQVQEIGCVVKDLDIGLIDFPTTFRGEEVYLCWKLGEAEIGFWHGVEEGFRGRKPIDKDFLEHHEGGTDD
jgi:hypothetical protein